jgi:hypothetical protein
VLETVLTYPLDIPAKKALPISYCELLFEPVGDAAPFEVVRADLDLYPVAGQYSDPVHPHLSRIMGQHFVPVIGFDAERRVFEGLDDRPFEQDRLLFSVGVRQCSSPPFDVLLWHALSMVPGLASSRCVGPNARESPSRLTRGP